MDREFYAEGVLKTFFDADVLIVKQMLIYRIDFLCVRIFPNG